MSAHALLSPSSAPRWMRCPGSVAACYGIEDTSSEYADEGTAAHTLAARCLQQGKQAEESIGSKIDVFEDDGKTVRRTFIVDPDMAAYVQVYVDAVRARVGTKLYEQRVNFSEFVGVDNSTGTGDAVVLDMDSLTLESHDLKFGKGVKVDASWVDDEGTVHPNEQLTLYLLGALSDNDLLADWENFVLAVHQPRIGEDGHYDELKLTRAELMAFAQSARAAAAEAMSGFVSGGATKDNGLMVPLPVAKLHELGMLRPGAKQCRFCPLAQAGECPALGGEAERVAVDPFGLPVVPDAVPLDDIPSPEKLELLELFLSGMRSRIQRELQAGKTLKLWKLVAGKKGARQWVEAKLAEAAKVMKKLLKKAAFTEPKLISPTQAEAALKKLKRKEEYAKLAPFITQSDGGEHVAPMSDPRPAVQKANVDQLLDVNGDLI